MRIFLAAAVLATACAHTQRPEPAPVRPAPPPWAHLDTNVADAFWGYNLLYYVGAVGATGAIALSGVDHDVHAHFIDHPELSGLSRVANIAGYVVPAVAAPTIWIVGRATHNRHVIGAGSAAIQAVVVTLATTGTLKLATGRPYPLEDQGLDPESARELEPFKNGFGAWPSGHTAATISIAAALWGYDPKQWWIPALGYPLAIGMGIGMVDRDSHWTSDIVAGALIGHAIGFSIGRSFRKHMHDGRTRDSFVVAPMIGAPGIAIGGAW